MGLQSSAPPVSLRNLTITRWLLQIECTEDMLTISATPSGLTPSSGMFETRLEWTFSSLIITYGPSFHPVNPASCVISVCAPPNCIFNFLARHEFWDLPPTQAMSRSPHPLHPWDWPQGLSLPETHLPTHCPVPSMIHISALKYLLKDWLSCFRFLPPRHQILLNNPHTANNWLLYSC